jgi:hypothetical protein
MIDIEAQVRTQVEAFVAELAVLVRQAAVEAVEAQFGGDVRARTPKAITEKAKVAPTPKAAPAAKPASAAKPPSHGAAKPAGAKAREPGQKRDPGELAKLVERVAEYIHANPGQRMEQIIPALGVPRKDLALPIQKLLRANRITSKGEKRGTVYTPK